MSSTRQDTDRDDSKLPSPAEVIARGLVEIADTGGHWYWLGDVQLEGIDPIPVFLMNGRAWLAIKLLMPTPEGLRVRHVNECGLRTCVNPGHWKFVPFRKEALVTNFDGKGWRKNG